MDTERGVLVEAQPGDCHDRCEGVEHEEEKRRRFEDGSEEVIGALIEVHRQLGPGLLESAYEACVCRELATRGLPFERQRDLPVAYKGILVECGYRLGIVVGRRILLELKAIDRLLPIHRAQVITYLRLSGLEVGLLVNFNVRVLSSGLHRLWPSTHLAFSSSSLRVNPPESG
jgi:GxxExxY protein